MCIINIIEMFFMVTIQFYLSSTSHALKDGSIPGSFTERIQIWSYQFYLILNGPYNFVHIQ